MYTHRNLMAKTFDRLTGATRLLTLKAFAEEGASNNSGDNNTSGVDVSQLIATARKEEKDKLYPRITELEAKVKSLSGDVKEYLTRIAVLTKELDEAKKSADTTDKDDKISDLTQQLNDAQEKLKNVPTEESIREKVKAEYELKYYADGLLGKNKDKLLSPFIPNVKGNTKEEIDSALQKAIEDSNALKKELGIEEKKQSEGKKSDKKIDSKRPPKQQRTALSEVEKFDYTLDDIQNLDPASEEYAEFRKKLGLK